MANGWTVLETVGVKVVAIRVVPDQGDGGGGLVQYAEVLHIWYAGVFGCKL